MNNFQSQTILIIDDEPANLGVIENYLDTDGFEILVAKNGKDGLEIAALGHPDLILLDVLMPGIDGFETCRRLKANDNTKDIPVIFMTALSQVEDKLKGFEAGGVDYITKPLQEQELLARIKTHLTLRYTQKRLEEKNAQLEQEIWHRQEAEQALLKSEQHLKAIFNNAGVGIAVTRCRDKRFIQVNAKFAAMLGYSEQELLNKTIFEVTHTDDINISREKLEQLAAQTIDSFWLEKRYVRKDDSTFWAELWVTPLPDIKGETQASIAILVDLTARKQAEEQIRKLSSAVEQSHNSIVITDLNGTIEFVNPAFSLDTGYSSAEAIGNNPRLLRSGKHSSEFYQKLWSTLRSGQVWQGELINKRKNGELYWESTTISPIKDKNSHITHYVAIKENITERKQAEQEIARLNERLKDENLRMKAELDIARQLQQMLLPTDSELRQIEDLEIACFMAPADEVGGDYYDVLQHNGRVLVGIGDVSGHGLESGVLAIMVQSSIRTLLANNETDPVKFLSALNQMIYHNVLRMNAEKHLTLALLNYQNGQLHLSGQHEEMIVVQNGTVERVDTDELGFPIGLEPDISKFIAQTQLSLNQGDVVVLYTDGITEAENIEGKLYGLERLCEVVKQNWQRSAQEIQQAVIADVRQHIGKQKVYDDITLLVIKIK